MSHKNKSVLGIYKSRLEAEMDLLVGLTACSHLGTNAGACKAIYYEVFNQTN